MRIQMLVGLHEDARHFGASTRFADGTSERASGALLAGLIAAALMAEFWRECCARLPRWPWLFACPGPCGDLEHSKCRELGRAGKHCQRSSPHSHRPLVVTAAQSGNM